MLLDLMKKRRSIRKYEQRVIEPEKIEMLKQAALLAPTSKNKRGWEYIFVENKETLKRLANAKSKGGLMVKDAALAIVVSVETSNNDVWIEDGSIGATYLHLMAEELGLGSCWVQIRNRFDEAGNVAASQNVKEILGIPDTKEVLCIMAIGYKDEFHEPHEVHSEDYLKIHTEKY